MKWYSLGVSSLLCIGLLTACGSTSSEQTELWSEQSCTGHMTLQYATEFSVDYYDPYALITIADNQQYLLVPEGETVPVGLDTNITVLQQPFQNLYVAASSAMDLFDGIGALEQVRMTSTTEKNWSLPHIQAALEQGTMLYVGKYSAPDYETILSQGCNLAIESTMIYHSPEIQEKLETLGIPVLVERSSYESHPLGRMEWMKLYGLLLNRETEADAYFTAQSEKLDSILTEKNTGKTVAFFYITTNGSVNIRKPGDYTSKMIELAGGKYIFDKLGDEDDVASTMSMQMEEFYAGAKDADYLIYNSTIDGGASSIEELLDKCEVLKDFKAVKNGDVWCTTNDMYQQSMSAGNLIEDFHRMLTGDDKEARYLYRLK
mgnify:CR=1 FL=1